MKTFHMRYVVLVGLLLSALTAHAVPVTYSLRFDALLGSSGAGSFIFDDDTGRLTNLVWDFGGGIVGGFSVFEPPIPPPIPRPFTSGEFLAEILTQTDLAAGVNCIGPGGACSSTRSGGIGVTPGNANGVTFSSGPSFGTSAFYSFANVTFQPPMPGTPTPPPVFGPSLANGYVTAFLSVPEPALMSLALVALLILGTTRRSARARS